jgi:hypothetical protein
MIFVWLSSFEREEKLGVAVVMMGRISRIVFRQTGDEVGLFRQKQAYVAVELQAKVFDVQGGREILAMSKSAEASDSLIAALEGDSESDLQEGLAKRSHQAGDRRNGT